MDKNLNNLLKWSIENTAPSSTSYTVTARENPSTNENTTTTGAADVPGAAPRPIDPAVMNALFGGPSEAELMKAAIEVITSPTSDEVPLDSKLTAFDNLEQLIESLDNANNLEPLALWSPLLSMLDTEEHHDLRRMAAWCVGTAVQNNVRTQERLLAMGGLPRLVRVATREDEYESVRRKAVYALSSAVRNYQPAMDVVADELHKRSVHKEKKQVDATDMDAVDEVINGLRELVAAATKS
ncbi:nucleotide exchange factor Fes1-domain-containing protein [Apodospora peruviana]|uniref:Nucleotide exchange factor Fes1-domain-containing protein n=1 Tax=Apodospora peruviana TaxID=516989 RepID=A0AAE0MBF8_9PEZI|nr:nucleotide exchange factor Fes1-domain-containing protein [Apodospora peruviana]